MYVDSWQVWMPTALEAVKIAASCRVPTAREFEMLPLWFFVVEVGISYASAMIS